MADLLPFSPWPAPPLAVARILARYNRPKLEAFIAIAIDLLDTLDGDPDIEEDDPAGGNVDDEGELLTYHRTLRRYGSDQTEGPISDHEAVSVHMQEPLP